jgi:hypothetical protein
MHCPSSAKVVRSATDEVERMTRKTATGSDTQTALRLPSDFLKRADSLRTAMTKADPSVFGFGRASRSAVLKIALDLGLKQLEQRYRPSRT